MGEVDRLTKSPRQTRSPSSYPSRARFDSCSVAAPEPNDLLRAFDDEITPWIEWPLGHGSRLNLGLATEHEIIAPEHDQ